MIKTLIILALLLVLLGGAAISRPSEAGFKAMAAKKMEQEGGNFLQKIMLQRRIDAYVQDCTYKNRLLWADVEKDGKVIYIGAFSKWFDRTDDKISKPEG